jgi:23S rRNA (cytidine1920-2'-O)/16S rRNA (cytidine1409-2'-O)-methyltransferase
VRIFFKPSQSIGEGDEVSIEESPLTRFVSRGGLKLEAALEAFEIVPEGFVCVDIGASTGGFTDCLLQNGAKLVYAVDSGSDQLHPSLRANENVVSMENVNARFLASESLAPCDLVVMDVSFISQSLLFPAVKAVLKEGGVFISLVKPQFEVGRENIGSGGVVRNEKARLACLNALKEKGAKIGLEMKKTIESPITGGDGNVEYLALWTRA